MPVTIYVVVRDEGVPSEHDWVNIEAHVMQGPADQAAARLEAERKGRDEVFVNHSVEELKLHGLGAVLKAAFTAGYTSCMSRGLHSRHHIEEQAALYAGGIDR